VRDTFIASLTGLAKNDPRVFLITGDLGFAVLDDYSRTYPRQFLNAGVAEQNMTGLATGLALDGRIVFTYSIGNFPTLRALEQIRNDAAYHDANVNVVAVGGGFSYGALGISHHATEDLAILRSLPGLTVVAPGDDWETEHAVPALAALPGTTYLRLDRASAGRTQREGETFVLGKARRLREGTDVTLVSIGGILGVTLAAADELAAQHGIRARVLSMHTLVPLDVESLMDAARETGAVITVEEHSVHGGLGGAVAENLLEAGVVPRAFHRVGLRHGFSSIVGSQDYLRTRYGLDAPAIIETVRRVVASLTATR
jgi:transketolase